ncbi:hypothetical protein JCGZ_23234 [Jatropha curcas]|uniref:RNase H type-1 domain-containing protein n=1 Tax=Jatropha curcas TaxID=180498 RepID=A0A067JHH9_JATCU|nr:hypothetical protein JCGZ_23234 [Jatropha curcas]
MIITWIRLRKDCYKLNIDASFNKFSASWGAILRNSYGNFVVAACFPIDAGTAYDAELKALIWGLSWSIDKGFYPIQVEMDCLELVTHVNRTQWIRAGPSVLQRVADLLHLHSSSIHHICREGNQATHLLATHHRLHHTSLSFTSFNSLTHLIKEIVLLEATGTQYLRYK